MRSRSCGKNPSRWKVQSFKKEDEITKRTRLTSLKIRRSRFREGELKVTEGTWHARAHRTAGCATSRPNNKVPLI
jgi:hypothetical protein